MVAYLDWERNLDDEMVVLNVWAGRYGGDDFPIDIFVLSDGGLIVLNDDTGAEVWNLPAGTHGFGSGGYGENYSQADVVRWFDENAYESRRQIVIDGLKA